MLTQPELKKRISIKNIEIINIDDGGIYIKESSNSDIINKSDDLAYVIYTSGTTGNPKGAMIHHKGVVNYIWWASKIYLQGEKLNFPLYTSISFDLTVTSIFVPLISGNSIILFGEAEKEILVSEVMKDKKVGIVKLTPSHLKIIKNNDNRNLTVKKLILGGENLETKLAEESVASFNSNIEIYNEYGPTETVVGCMIYKYNGKEDKRQYVPVGVPSDNVKIYILDKNMKMSAPGVLGEMYISGDGLARGYLNRPELTENKFVDNPFDTGTKMYRTGDLARFLSDGNIECIGRIDHQVKIRGYRIELGEIENHLLKFDSINETAVIACDDVNGNKYLCAYIISESDLTISDLREKLSQVLPEYMIPQYFVRLEKFPLTSNGKIDRNALLDYKGNIKSGTEYIAPRNHVEEMLVEIWKDVLGISEIGINDGFFNIGGDSIKALQVSARLQNYGLKTSMKELFQHPTISELSSYIKLYNFQIDQGIVSGKVEYTPIQKWFFENKFTDSHHYNQSVMIFRKDGFKEEIIIKIFDKLVIHHDILRMVLKLEEDTFIQFNNDENCDLYNLNIYDLRNDIDYKDKIVKIADEIQESINLTTGPLIKLGLFQTTFGDHLLIVIHHLVIDGVSWRILLEDFYSSFVQLNKKDEIKLPSKTNSFKFWSEKLMLYSNSKELLREMTYWKDIESIEIKPLVKNINIGHKNKIKDTSYETILLTKEDTERLLMKVNKAYNTEINDILLTALSLSIKEFTGENNILINLEGHGREEIMNGIDISRTVGWFTTSFPVVFDMSKSNDLAYQIKYLKESLRKIPNKGIGYGILKYLTSRNLKDELNFKLNPEINFNYLGQFDKDFQIGDIEVSSISPGNLMSKNLESLFTFDINGMIAGERLKIMVTYNRNEYDKKEVEGLADSFKNNLLKIINHCLQKEITEYTPHDFGDNDLSLEELEDISNSLNKE
jgi:amino acid adenylation domain-containing protein/non-ribosomal peptide synthase protein (TIGR01720 family)